MHEEINMLNSINSNYAEFNQNDSTVKKDNKQIENMTINKKKDFNLNNNKDNKIEKLLDTFNNIENFDTSPTNYGGLSKKNADNIKLTNSQINTLNNLKREYNSVLQKIENLQGDRNINMKNNYLVKKNNSLLHKNIYVNTISNKVFNTTYVGCYSDDPSTPLMTFVNGSPPKNYIKNGNFSQPDIGNNNFQFISSFTKVPGWVFYCYFLNNSDLNVPRPYPAGKQCALLRDMQNIVQSNINLNSGTYNLSFYTTGWNQKNVPVNPLTITLKNSAQKTTFTTPHTPQSNSTWNQENISVSVDANDTYTLSIVGSLGNGWTAIQGISLSEGRNATISSSSENDSSSPSFTYDMCKNAAIMSGNRFFALQDFNESTQSGYCAIGNNKLTATSLGKSTTVSGGNVIWSFKTEGTGNTATLTTLGELVVYDSNTNILNQTKNNNKKSTKSSKAITNYIGCYRDNPNRAMPLYRGGSRQYNYDSCEQIAKDNNYKYFGIQYSIPDGSKAQCALSNDINHSRMYGKANNCFEIKQGYTVGSGWSNAIYNVDSPDSYYYLILQDDGNMVIYRGTGPNDNQGLIWSSNTSSQKQQPNDNYKASKGKFGKNWINNGATMSSGDWIGSTDGSIYLLMQSNGNLTLNTSTVVGSCKTINKTIVGARLSNAIYDLGNTGYPQNVGKMAYINNNGQKMEYPASMLTYSDNEYTKIINYSSDGTSLSTMKDQTEDTCKVFCSKTNNCSGFIYDTSSKSCDLRNSDNIFPKSSLKNAKNKNLFFRKPAISKFPVGVPRETNNVDSIFYQNIRSGDMMTPDYSGNEESQMSQTQRKQLEQYEGQLLLLGNKISEINEYLKNQNLSGYQQSLLNNDNIEKNIDDNYMINGIIDYKETTDIINMNAVLKDTDMIVLQKNTSFLFWSILTVGVVLISINVMNRNG
jgi:hypothetical protein